MEIYDLIIVGSGPAGLSASIYAGRSLMKTLVIGEESGGEAGRAGVIWNYPGFKNIDGYELTILMKEQAKDMGVKFYDEKVSEIKKDDEGFKVTAEGKEFSAKSVILASGSERRKLGLPNEVELKGKGVHYCVVCDGPVYTGKTIAIVGGGSAAVKSAIAASGYAKKIYMIVLESELIGEPASIELLKKIGSNIEFLFKTQIKELKGEEKLESLILDNKFQDSNELKIDGLFIEIGSMPKNELAKSLEVALDKRGYIEVDASMNTNIPGIFAAGDIANLFGNFKQIITSTGMGAVAANSAYHFIKGK